MPAYLTQVAYSTEAWAALLKNPQDRTKAVQEPIKKLGGKVENFWFSFGEYDVVGVINFPNNVSAVAGISPSSRPQENSSPIPASAAPRGCGNALQPESVVPEINRSLIFCWYDKRHALCQHPRNLTRPPCVFGRRMAYASSPSPVR